MSSSDLIPEALADALGKIVADCRREWLAELEQLRTERRLLVAELRLAALGITTEAPADAAKAVAKPKGGVRA
ncbi:hypothetical protein [Bosea sp. LjRoot237]|uniref:hypothetical protein n=1 Tax=Bosea sp. LjRoot237 TaxID=3342292 RepID=UPI003ED1466E